MTTLSLLQLLRPLVASCPAGFRPQLNRDIALALLDAEISRREARLSQPRNDSGEDSQCRNPPTS